MSSKLNAKTTMTKSEPTEFACQYGKPKHPEYT